ncbi:Mobile element protein [Arcticibacter svalbardensis MN12-7]|uniref:Mobile element protein n=1 Tax=Arcticibacter svalbardensis MN12-7 TaxID=1150600 RepID=R9H5G1_9SPHI|nr:Mobile element protein [Arcticibacter svalbardensis MN12-7]
MKVDIGSKLITGFQTSSASVHDSEILPDLLNEEDCGKPLYADSAYRSDKQEAALKTLGIKSEIHERAYRNTPLSQEQKLQNREKSKVRARVEHVFAWMHRQGHELKVMTIGIERATAKITLMNMVYNMTRAIHIIQSGRRSVSIL